MDIQSQNIAGKEIRTIEYDEITYFNLKDIKTAEQIKILPRDNEIFGDTQVIIQMTGGSILGIACFEISPKSGHGLIHLIGSGTIKIVR